MGQLGFSLDDLGALRGVACLLSLAALTAFAARWKTAKPARVALLLLLLAFAGDRYFGYGRGVSFHASDVHAYYLGAKYFPEVRYDLLPQSMILADQASGLRFTDLSNGVYFDPDAYGHRPAKEALAQAEKVRARFTPERWAAFQADQRFFQEHMDAPTWAVCISDRSNSSSPVTNAVAGLVAKGVPAPEAIPDVAYLDPLLFLAACLVVAWGFGVEAGLFFAVFLFSNDTHNYTHGCFLRQDWFFALAAAAALLRRGHPVGAGAALAYATATRVFPCLFLAGVVAVGIHGLLRRDRRAVTTAALAVGGFLGGLALLAGFAALYFGETRCFFEFARQIGRYAAMPSMSNVSLTHALVGTEFAHRAFAFPVALFGAFVLRLGLAAWAFAALKKAAPHEGFLLGPLAVFLVLAPFETYWVMAAFPLLLFAQRLPHGGAAWGVLLWLAFNFHQAVGWRRIAWDNMDWRCAGTSAFLLGLFALSLALVAGFPPETERCSTTSTRNA